MLGLAAVVGIVWIGDWLLLKRKGDDGIGSVEVQHRFEVKLKNRRIEQRTEKPHDEECVQSLFPHNGDDPCWYMAKHAQDVEEIDGNRWQFYNP